jgi:hypothetical protein
MQVDELNHLGHAKASQETQHARDRAPNPNVSLAIK